MNRKISFLSASVFIIAFASFSSYSFVFAQELSIPDNPNHERIIDNANILSDQEEQKILQTIQRIETETTAQIAILTIPTLGESEIFDYGMRVLEHENWQVGQDDKDNGLFILIASNDRKYRLFSGYGLEGILPDLRLQQIATKHFPLSFRNAQYGTGIENGLIDIEKFLVSDPEIISEYSQNENNETNMFAMIMLVVFSFLAGIFISTKKEKTRNISLATGSTFIGISILTPFIILSGGLIALFIFWITSQPSNKKDNNFFDTLLQDSLMNSRGGWSSGGGFSSSGGFSNFGGGDFGGGGFGGDW